MDRVTSGTGRTALRDNATDFYPVPLEHSTLWPGTVFADPYGHTLIIVKWLPQMKGRSGLLLAVDAQPDNSVARKRFWEGNFLFAVNPNAGPGFKAYRPPVAVGGKRGWVTPTNTALNKRSGRSIRSNRRISRPGTLSLHERLINRAVRPGRATRPPWMR
jgi:hypothetical protein